MAAKQRAGAPRAQDDPTAPATAKRKTSRPGAATRRPAKSQFPPPPPLPNGANPAAAVGAAGDAGDVLNVGRLAGTVSQRAVQWLWAPWVARSVLTFVVGQPGVGKSSLLAYLCSQADNVVLLPGSEEPFEQMTLPRLRAHGVDLNSVYVLDGRRFHLRAHLDLLCRVTKARRADLVLLDPIDSYLDEDTHENDSQAVRLCLEAAVALAERTGAAVVGTRHPGKDPANVCPGGRAWRAVPRCIVELVEEPTTPPQRYLRGYKYSLGDKPSPMAYGIVRQTDGPPLFVPGDQVDAELAHLAAEVPDRMERSKVQTACELLRHLLHEQELEAREVFSWGEKERLSEITLRRAARLLGLDYRREGFGLDCRCYWSLPKPLAPSAAPGGGVPVSVITSGGKP